MLAIMLTLWRSAKLVLLIILVYFLWSLNARLKEPVKDVYSRPPPVLSDSSSRADDVLLQRVERTGVDKVERGHDSTD